MRMLYSDNGVLTDYTRALENYYSGTASFSYVQGEDYLYISSDLPFNHFYLKLGATVNAIAATMSIEAWSGRGWEPVVEIIDETSAGGKSLAQSGFVEFTPERSSGWRRESTNDQGAAVEGLESVVIYDMYWIRISFSATLTPDVGISWIGSLFSHDQDLFSEHPVMSTGAFMGAHTSGKTTWEEQHVLAAKILIKDLKSRGIILATGQILRRNDYALAAVSKTAQLIFGSMGDDYVDDVKAAKIEYDQRLDLKIHQIDQNANGVADPQERFSQMGFMSR